MKRGFVLFVFALLTFAPSLFAADSSSQPLVPSVQSAPEQPQAPAEGTPALSTIPDPKYASTCEEDTYASCMLYCYDLSMTNGCGFYASQACLCWRYPWADCPVCY